MMQLVASSGLFKKIYSAIAQVCGGDEKAQDILSDTMETITLLMMALGEAKGSSKNAAGLLEALKPHLEKKFEGSTNFMQTILEDAGSDDGQAKGMEIALQQARIALTKDDYSGLLGAQVWGLRPCELEPRTPKRGSRCISRICRAPKRCLLTGSIEKKFHADRSFEGGMINRM